MTEPEERQAVTVDAAGEAFIRWVLALDADAVAAVRAATPGRSRPLTQRGPTAEYGEPDVAGG